MNELGNKIIIIGSPGAGKSTFSVKLHEKLKLPLYHLDMIYLREDKTNIDKEEFDKILTDVMSNDSWILDGNYDRTLEWRTKECDTIIFLDYDLNVCIDGIKSRIGNKNVGTPFIEEKLDEEFYEKVLNFRDNKLPHIYEIINKFKNKKNIIIFKNRKESELYLENL